jgi:hypothetical protein
MESLVRSPRSKGVGGSFCLWLLIGGLGLACAATATRPPPPQREIGATHLALPTTIDGFQMVERHDYEEQGMGTLIRYRGESALQPDVFVYPIPNPQPGAALSEWFRKEGQGFREMFEINRSRGEIDSFTVESEEEIRLQSRTGALQAFRMKVSLAVRGDPRDSYVYLVPFGNNMLKLRATHAPEAVSAVEVESFVESLVAVAVADNAPQPAAQAR